MIREAILSDFDAIAVLEEQVHNIHFAARPDIFLEKPFNGNNIKKRDCFENWLQHDDKKIFVFEESGEILGYCETVVWDYEDDRVFKDVIILFIYSMCVDEKARGKHIGQRLFEAAKAHAKKIGAVRLQLDVADFNENAKKFYDHLGMSTRSTCMELEIK